MLAQPYSANLTSALLQALALSRLIKILCQGTHMLATFQCHV